MEGPGLMPTSCLRAVSIRYWALGPVISMNRWDSSVCVHFSVKVRAAGTGEGERGDGEASVVPGVGIFSMSSMLRPSRSSAMSSSCCVIQRMCSREVRGCE